MMGKPEISCITQLFLYSKFVCKVVVHACCTVAEGVGKNNGKIKTVRISLNFGHAPNVNGTFSMKPKCGPRIL